MIMIAAATVICHPIEQSVLGQFSDTLPIGWRDNQIDRHLSVPKMSLGDTRNCNDGKSTLLLDTYFEGMNTGL